jgi:hypothetical protein
VFDDGQQSAGDQMHTSWEKLVQYFGTNYGKDINNELQNKVWVVLTEPVHTNDVLARRSVREVMIRNGQLNIQQARQTQDTTLKASVQAGTYMDAPMKLAVLQNKIARGEFAASIEVPVELTDSEKTQFSNDWCNFREHKTNLIKHRCQYSSDWNTVSILYDPLNLHRLIERNVMAQTEDQYPFATVNDQEISFYSFKQDNMSNPQWIESFTTKADVSRAIGVT